MEINTKTKIIELRAKGYTFSKIAKEVGISKQTAIDECKRNEELLTTLHAIEIEELIERYKITREERLKAHASLLNRIRDEIERRDLADVSTEKLIDLYLKQSATLKAEIIEPTYRSSEEQERDRAEREYISAL